MLNKLKSTFKMMKVEAIFFIFFVTFQACLCKQTWQEEPKYTEVNPGESTTLACKIYNKKGTCSWQKDGKPQGMFTGKIEWAGDQTSGDCSLRVFDASDVDDGDWECQVTASSFSAHDALTSSIVKLAVRVRPNSPQLEIGSSQVSERRNFTVREGTPAVIKCVSRYGNPPSRMKWFLGSEELPQSSYDQINQTEPDRPKTYMAVSTLQTLFNKEEHAKSLRCVSVHEAYDTKSREVSIALDVQYSPTVTLQGAPAGDIEEGQDRVALQCLSDANPPANIIWKRVGEENVFSFQETVEFNPVTRKHSGTYACKASNNVGVSDPLSVRLEVKYPPKILEVGPEPILIANLGNSTSIQCQAVGDPIPSFEWFQVTPNGRKIKRGSNATLIIQEVTYEHQGQYFCIAHNVIKGSRKDDHSTPVALEVLGKPHVLRYTVEKQLEVQRGDDALIQMTFCSDPEPKQTTWEWGSLQLQAGNGKGRYVAERLAQESGSTDCYQARLRIQHVDMSDARNYYLTVINERGEDQYEVTLTVKEPVTMSTVIGIVIACLVILVVVTMGIFYAFKTEKCCFSQRNSFKTTDVENNKNGMEQQKTGHGRPRPLTLGNREGGTLVGGTLSSIPPDAVYLGTQNRTRAAALEKLNHEYENLKTLRARMGTQNAPTVLKTGLQARTNSSSNSSTQSNPSTWGKKDKIQGTINHGMSGGTLWHTHSSNSRLLANPTTTESQEQSNGSNSVPPFAARNLFSSPTRQSVNNSDPKNIHFMGPPSARERFEPGVNSPRRHMGSNIVYAELQLPRASNNGSLRGVERGSNLPHQTRILPRRTQYAEITFQREQQHLQSAHI